MTNPCLFDPRACVRAALALTSVLFLVSSLEAIEKWRDIPPEAFEQQASDIDPDANVEIIFAEMKASQHFDRNGLRGFRRTYLRMKVFNEAGVSALAKHIVEPEFEDRIKRIEARTVKPDGTVYELDSKDVYDLKLEEDRDGSRRAKSFAFPSLEAGDIVEYQVEYDIDDVGAVYARFTHPYPCRRVTVRIKPAEALSHRVISFGFPLDRLNQKEGDYYLYEMEDLRAQLKEKYALPRLQSEPHVVMYYVREFFEDPEDFWDDFSKDLAGDARSDFKANKAVKEKVKELLKGAQGDEEKLRRLLAFCTEEITNLNWDHKRYSEVERKDLKDNKTPADTLKNGYANPRHLRALFGALATEAGFDARYVAIGDKSRFFFSRGVSVRFVLQGRLVAIKSGDSWLFFDPGNPALRFGELSWKQANSLCLVGDRKEIRFVQTPSINSEDAIANTVAELKISEDGTLSGRVSRTLFGQKALIKRDAYRKLPLPEIEEEFKEEELRHYADGKMENFVLKNRYAPEKPLVLSYDLEIKDYADVVGERLIFAPALYHKELSTPFTKEERDSDIVFNSPWRDVDRIEITLPEGYAFEAGDAPKPFDLGGVLVFDAKILVNKKTNTLILNREFQVNQEIMPQKAYGVVKSAFEALKIEDGKSITAKKAHGGDS